MNKRWVKQTAAGGIALLMALWAWSYFHDDGYSSDPEVAALERLRDASFRNGKPGEGPSAEFRERMDNLSDDQRHEFFARGMAAFAPMMERQMNGFFALPPEKQREQIDREIDGMEQMRAQMEADGIKGPGGPPFGGDMSPGKMNEMMKRMLDSTSPEMRSMFERKMKMMNDRREERGLEAFGPGT